MDEEENVEGRSQGRDEAGVTTIYNINNSTIHNFCAEGSPRSPTAQSPFELSENIVDSFKEKVKSRTSEELTKRVTGEDIAQRKVYSDEPILPVLKKIDFFQGRRTDIASNQSIEEWRGENIDYLSLHSNRASGGVCRHTVLVGDVGTGKTTLLKEYTEAAIEEKTTPNTFELVHYIYVGNSPSGNKEKVSCRKILFGNELPEAEEEELEHGFTWIKKNQEKVLFVFDGIKYSNWDKTNKENGKIGYNDEATVDTIYYNILCGRLFPKSFILTSTRPHDICAIPADLRPDRCVGLCGLDNKSIDKLLKIYNRDDASIIEKIPDAIRPIISIPFYLKVAVLTIRQSIELPKSLTGLIVSFVKHQIQSEHITQFGLQAETIKKLKELSYNASMKNKLTFTPEDFRKVGLAYADTADIVMKSLKRNKTNLDFGNINVMEGDMVNYLCHPSIQDCLSACHVIDLPGDEFADFFKQSSNLYFNIQRMICGILLNPIVEEVARDAGKFIKGKYHYEYIAMDSLSFLEIDDEAEAKKEILLDHLAGRCRELFSLKSADEHHHSQDSLDLIEMLQESSEEKVSQIIQTEVKRVSFDDLNLSPTNIHNIKKFFKACSQLRFVSFANCFLDKEFAEEILIELSALPRVEKINVSNNTLSERSREIIEQLEIGKAKRLKLER